MSSFGRRQAPRKRVSIEATISGSEDGVGMSCLIRDASRTGCRITAPDVRDLPEKVWLRLKGFTSPIPGRIVWRRIQSAGIRFEWEEEGPAHGRSTTLLDI